MNSLDFLTRSHILFDLDGTLTDPRMGITNSVAYALKQFGITVEHPHETLTSFIGPPLIESFETYYSLTPEQARLALGYYRAYFVPTGMFENTVYPGIPDALERLRQAGRTLCVATSKPEVYARRILEHFSLDTYFEAVCGATLDESRVRKADVIAYALETLNINADQAVLVGDRLHDVEGAHACNVPVIGVTYGYGSREELTAAGADALADHVSDAVHILLGRRD